MVLPEIVSFSGINCIVKVNSFQLFSQLDNETQYGEDFPQKMHLLYEMLYKNIDTALQGMVHSVWEPKQFWIIRIWFNELKNDQKRKFNLLRGLRLKTIEKIINNLCVLEWIDGLDTLYTN